MEPRQVTNCCTAKSSLNPRTRSPPGLSAKLPSDELLQHLHPVCFHRRFRQVFLLEVFIFYWKVSPSARNPPAPISSAPAWLECDSQGIHSTKFSFLLKTTANTGFLLM